MSPIRLRGMTWDHRRAVDPLLATQAMFAQKHPGIEIAVLRPGSTPRPGPHRVIELVGSRLLVEPV